MQTRDCSVVELRQYALHPGKRDVLIELFDREFVETQEEVGAQVLGQFRDLDEPNHFVWLRGFRDMTARRQALSAFYGGAVWRKHREAANATMVDSSDVLLLRPVRLGSGFSPANADRPPVGASDVSNGLVVATIFYLEEPADRGFAGFFERNVEPALRDVGTSILASFMTESSANDFPALPVRENENVFIWFARFSDRLAHERHLAALAQLSNWREISEVLTRRFNRPAEVLRLSPTGRSLLRA